MWFCHFGYFPWCTVGDKYIHYKATTHIRYACGQFAVRERACAPFAKLDVAGGVQQTFFFKGFYCFNSFVNFLTHFQHHRFKTHSRQHNGRKDTCRTETAYNRRAVYLFVTYGKGDFRFFLYRYILMLIFESLFFGWVCQSGGNAVNKFHIAFSGIYADFVNPYICNPAAWNIQQFQCLFHCL